MADEEWIEIEGRRIKIADGRTSQTINICTAANYDGTYERVYRINAPNPFAKLNQLSRCETLEALYVLMTQRGASEENARDAR